MKNTSTFKSKHLNEVYQAMKNFSCNSKMVVYLTECRVCGKQYNGSTMKKLCARANNYKNTHHSFQKEQCQTKLLTRNIFMNICRLTITRLVTGRS